MLQVHKVESCVKVTPVWLKEFTTRCLNLSDVVGSMVVVRVARGGGDSDGTRTGGEDGDTR